jgi:Ser/Thr protein kinase RdoA (MazF antagonist)
MNKLSWVLRAYHRSFVEDEMFGWLSRYPSLFEWLQTRASILMYLTQQGYPVPLVVSAQAGAWIGFYQEWYMLMTTFVDGDAKETTPEKMQALAASLGCLHTLPLPEAPSAARSVGVSWWEPTTGIRDALDRLGSSAESIPTEWQEAHAAFLQTFHTFQQHPHIPRTLIHGDCWAENGIRTQEERATLIDWECAGLGIAIADLGSLLLHCHFDQFDNSEYRPDPQRIASVVQGYCLWRSPGSEELAVLLEAIRFSISWRGASLCQHGARHGWNEKLQQSLTRWWRWYAISEEIAHISRACIEQRL